MRRQTLIKRAFEIAREAGGQIDLNALEARLSREGYENVGPHMRSKTLRDQLYAVARSAREN